MWLHTALQSSWLRAHPLPTPFYRLTETSPSDCYISVPLWKLFLLMKPNTSSYFTLLFQTFFFTYYLTSHTTPKYFCHYSTYQISFPVYPIHLPKYPVGTFLDAFFTGIICIFLLVFPLFGRREGLDWRPVQIEQHSPCNSNVFMWTGSNVMQVFL